MKFLVGKLMSAGFVTLATRGAALLLRFGLTFYIVSYLGLRAAGIYGLAVGAVGILPAAIGWGLNYFVSREVVGQTPDRAAPLVRDRLIVTLLSLCAVTVAAGFYIATLPVDQRTTYGLVLVLIWMETLALDIYMPLIGLEMALLANVLVFVRSALWVPFVVLPGLLDPALRSLDLLFVVWIASHVVANIVLWYALRRWPIRQALSSPRDLGWAVRCFRANWFIYVSDIGLVGLIFVDRYIVNYVLGLAATGIYTFYWSITNALQTLIGTAVLQIALPRLVRAFRGEEGLSWGREIRRQIANTLGLATLLSMVIFAATEAIIRFSPPGRFPVDRALFAMLLAAAVVRASSDMLNIGLTSTGADRHYAATNFIGMLLTIGLGFGFMRAYGLTGAGIAMLSTAVILFVMRVALLRWVRRRQRIAAPALSA